MISPEDFETVLGYYPVLRDLPLHLREAFQAHGQPLQPPGGQVVFDAGRPCHAFILLCSGAIRVETLGSVGRAIVLYRVEPGGTCVLTVGCLLGSANNTARGIAETALSGFAIPAPVFRAAVEESSPFRWFILRLFAEGMMSLMLRIEEVAFHTLDQRLAALLLSRGATVEATHQMLADELGSVREVVSRTLKQFEERGLVRLVRGRVQVLDSPSLGRLAGALHDDRD